MTLCPVTAVEAAAAPTSNPTPSGPSGGSEHKKVNSVVSDLGVVYPSLVNDDDITKSEQPFI